MFARVTFSQVALDKANEAENIMRDVVLPMMRQQKGFKNYCSFVDRESGRAITVTIWETEADRQASGQPSEYYREAIAKVSSFFTAPPVVENYEAEIYN
jgi:heme-degrading monooxygenase HmoA